VDRFKRGGPDGRLVRRILLAMVPLLLSGCYYGYGYYPYGYYGYGYGGYPFALYVAQQPYYGQEPYYSGSVVPGFAVTGHTPWNL
jgi:hypothetical protein